MILTKQQLAMALAIVATLGLGGCATYKEEFATINSRLDSLDAKGNSKRVRFHNDIVLTRLSPEVNYYLFV